MTHGHRLHFDIERDFGIGLIKTIFDVGANTGQTATRYLVEFPDAKVFCFEPVSAAFDALTINLKMLNIDARWDAHRMALGDRCGKTDIYIPEDNRLSSLRYSRSSDKVEIAPIMTLDAVCEDLHIERIDLLKIDAEGSELDILDGADKMLKEDRIAFIQVEAAPHNTGYFIGFCQAQRKLHQFELYGIYDQTQHFTGRKSMLFANLVFVNQHLLKEPRWTNTLAIKEPV